MIIFTIDLNCFNKLTELLLFDISKDIIFKIILLLENENYLD